MLLIASLSVLFVTVKSLTKTVSAKLACMLDVGSPGSGPADVLNEAARLAKGEIDRGDPWPGRGERSLKTLEVRPSHERLHAQDIVLKRANYAGDRFSLRRFAGEINAQNLHSRTIAKAGDMKSGAAGNRPEMTSVIA